MQQLHPLVNAAVRRNRQQKRTSRVKETLPNYSEGEFVLVARDVFTTDEKLSLRWQGPRRIVKALSSYVFQLEDLRNGDIDKVHGTRLKFYHDASPITEAIMSHLLAFKTGMIVRRLMGLVELSDGLHV